MLGVLACLDVAQITLDIFGIGLIANRYIDIIVALALILYLPIRRVPLDFRTMAIIGGSFLAEEIPIVDAAPFWCYAVWKIKQWNQTK